MFKLNFEKTAIFVLILILCISTVNIYDQYSGMFFNRRARSEAHTDATMNISFHVMLLKADQLSEKGLYKDAQNEYIKLTSMSNLSLQQKATVYFKLGICNYRLDKYDIAINSFLKSAEYNTNDPAAYNNAAVSAFYLNDLKKAEELQKKAIANLPVIEYYYNLARIYETSGRYADSVKYYEAVIGGEENITREDRIDPVRIKNKVMKLMQSSKMSNISSRDFMMALKLNDGREVFIIDDINMDIKDKDFKWDIVKEEGINKLKCFYDREGSDPYNLVDSLKWTVKSGENIVYTGKDEAFTLSLVQGKKYIVYLDIEYNSNKHARSYVDINRSNIMYSNNNYPVASPSNAKCKYYEYAAYEQVFEKDFHISRKGYKDRFGTQWGKDDIETKVMDKDFIDAQSALYIKNTSDKNSGIWADLSTLINDKRLKGKTIGIKFYARKVTANANLNVDIRVKSAKVYKNTFRNYDLEYKWKRFGVDVFIPENADGLTISFETPSKEEIKIDGFIITIVR